MRRFGVLLFALLAWGTAAAAQGTMSELMVHMIYPTSDAIFYISTRTPKTDAEWAELQAKTLTLAESANLLMLPSRARGAINGSRTRS